ncbi:MAG TPA: hypothetical protein DD390_12065 [Rhodospirillaceae bacterium]|jgi:hypothetical protein|nr:hypothetical protein [Rhodospirillaceae bacterium]MAX61932.1 hypothetical protein [Rhodospirillaceae bacterium]MAX63268.1 hypothetical protein [Rhodospirillaceae bacterium]HBM13422.1 hypothetical protein [Rhodospirillaceae bacterium]|tara:strand:+ start:893 stop:1321 length:429 start_codon:yes stop_codon:yes gene_type:complete
MSSHRELTAKTGLIRDPAAELAALKTLAEMAQSVLDNPDQASRIQIDIGVDLPWLKKLANRQLPLSDIDAGTITQVARFLELPFQEVFPINPYTRAQQPDPSNGVASTKASTLGRRLGDLDQHWLDAIYDRATGAMAEGCSA